MLRDARVRPFPGRLPDFSKLRRADLIGLIEDYTGKLENMNSLPSNTLVKIASAVMSGDDDSHRKMFPRFKVRMDDLGTGIDISRAFTSQGRVKPGQWNWDTT